MSITFLDFSRTYGQQEVLFQLKRQRKDADRNIFFCCMAVRAVTAVPCTAGIVLRIFWHIAADCRLACVYLVLGPVIDQRRYRRHA